MDNRQALNAIFYLLRTGCHWKALPRSLGAASTVYDRFRLWVEQGVFERMLSSYRKFVYKRAKS